ncbi:hypothetical protein B0A48_00578 [Cryoendolithus antarcticus]|uniref:Uncharacterized protein n=1 Tax=Cryoendolithus antarcticus TaxID=1507870 RepID=A0A1V8TUX4_9PEZI|nr:hypothetical protein B0A48_00578 [Cryoendolithus antarcticus]
MGGCAFAQAEAPNAVLFHMPRMSPEQYGHLRQAYTERLNAYFAPAYVKPLIDAPEKLDYGDIDFHLITTQHTDWAAVASAIGAAAFLDRGSTATQKCSFAVKLDGNRSSDLPVQYTLYHASKARRHPQATDLTEGDYAQIDVETVPPELEKWRSFYDAYGDLSGIIGYMTTKLGFSICDKGLRLRLQEFDDASKPEWAHFRPVIDEGRMLLCSDVDQILGFLGLSAKKYHEGFTTIEQVFKWAKDCRMVSGPLGELWRKEAKINKLKANRSMFLDFFETYLPRHLPAVAASPAPAPSAPSPATPPPAPDHTSLIRAHRTTLLTQALQHFNKTPEYTVLHSAFLHTRRIASATHLLRSLLASATGKSGSCLTELLRAMRRHCAFRDGEVVVLEQRVGDAETELGSFAEEVVGDGEAVAVRLRDEAKVREWIASGGLAEVKECERRAMKEGRGEV